MPARRPPTRRQPALRLSAVTHGDGITLASRQTGAKTNESPGSTLPDQIDDADLTDTAVTVDALHGPPRPGGQETPAFRNAAVTDALPQMASRQTEADGGTYRRAREAGTPSAVTPGRRKKTSMRSARILLASAAAAAALALTAPGAYALTTIDSSPPEGGGFLAHFA